MCDSSRVSNAMLEPEVDFFCLYGTPKISSFPSGHEQGLVAIFLGGCSLFFPPSAYNKTSIHGNTTNSPSPEQMAEHVAQPEHRQESHQLTVPNPPAQPLEWDRTGLNTSPWAHKDLGSCSALLVWFASTAATAQGPLCTGNPLTHGRAAAPALVTEALEP